MPGRYQNFSHNTFQKADEATLPPSQQIVDFKIQPPCLLQEKETVSNEAQNSPP